MQIKIKFTTLLKSLLIGLGSTLIISGIPPACQSFTNHDMKTLNVAKIEYTGETDLNKIPQLLEEQTTMHSIDVINWSEFPYKPNVSFRIGHANNQIWIVFYVTEKHVLAIRTTTNSSTHKDSCVEFFIDPKQDGHYYNFEFNAIGTTHLAYGPSIRERKFIDPEKIQSLIQTQSSLGQEPLDIKDGDQSWQLTVIIPAEIFMDDQPMELSKFTANANFFKCGDETTEPHFLSWNPVGTNRPSFHQPQYFGKLVFE